MKQMKDKNKNLTVDRYIARALERYQTNKESQAESTIKRVESSSLSTVSCSSYKPPALPLQQLQSFQSTQSLLSQQKTPQARLSMKKERSKLNTESKSLKSTEEKLRQIISTSKALNQLKNSNTEKKIITKQPQSRSYCSLNVKSEKSLNPKSLKNVNSCTP